MEIKVQVEISLSKSSETFLQNLINSVLNANIRETSVAAPSRPSVKAEDANESPAANTECCEQAIQKQTNKPEKVVVEKPEKVVVEKPEKVVVEKPEKVVVEKPEESSEEKPSTYTVEYVRELGKKYINTHRNEIKAKLTELGAQNITKLDPAHYAEFVEYIESVTK